MKTSIRSALALVLSLGLPLGCAGPDSLGETEGASTVTGSGGSGAMFDAGHVAVADAIGAGGSDAGSSPGWDAGAGSDGSGSGSGSGCSDGLYFLDAFGTQYNLAGDAIALDPHEQRGSAPFSFAATGLPPGLAMSSSTGRITGTLGPSAQNGSPYVVSVSISDHDGVVRSTSFRWRVERRALPHYESGAGETVAVTLPPASAAPFAVAVSGLPPGLSVDPGTGAIAGVVAPGASLGSYVVTVTTTGMFTTDTYSFLWWVFGASAPDLPTGPRDQTSWDGDTAALKLPTPPGAPPFTYQVTNLPPGIELDAATATLRGTVLPDGQAITPYDVVVTANASNGIVTTYAFQWSIYTYANQHAAIEVE